MGKLHIFTDPPENLYLGGSEILKIFCGEELVWPMLIGKKILVYDAQRQMLEEIDALSLFDKAKKQGTFTLERSYPVLGQFEPEKLLFKCNSSGVINVSHPSGGSLLYDTYSNLSDPSYVVLGMPDREEDELHNLVIRSWTSGGYSTWGEWLTNSEAAVNPPFEVEIPSSNDHKYTLKFTRSGSTATLKITRDDTDVILTKTGSAKTLSRSVYYLATGKMFITYDGEYLGTDPDTSVVDYCDVTDHITDYYYPKSGSRSWTTPQGTTVTLKWTATKDGAAEMPIRVNYTLIDGHGFPIWAHSIGCTDIDDVAERASYAIDSFFDVQATPLLTKNVNLWATISEVGLGNSGYVIGNAMLDSMFDSSVLITSTDLEQIYKMGINSETYNLMKSVTSVYGKFNIYAMRSDYTESTIFLTSPDIPVTNTNDAFIVVNGQKELLRYRDTFNLLEDNALNLGVPGGFLHIQQRIKSSNPLAYKELDKFPFARLGGTMSVPEQKSFALTKTYTAPNGDKLSIAINSPYPDQIIAKETNTTKSQLLNTYTYDAVQMDDDQYLTLTQYNAYSSTGAFVIKTPKGTTSYPFNTFNTMEDVDAYETTLEGTIVKPFIHIDKTYDFGTLTMSVEGEEIYQSASTDLYSTSKPTYTCGNAKYKYTYKTTNDVGTVYETRTIEIPTGQLAFTGTTSDEKIYELETSSTGFKDALLKVTPMPDVGISIQAYSKSTGAIYDTFVLSGADLLKDGEKTYTRVVGVPVYKIIGRDLKTGTETVFLEANLTDMSNTDNITKKVTLNGWEWKLEMTRHTERLVMRAAPIGNNPEKSWYVDPYTDHVLSTQGNISEDHTEYFDYSTAMINCYFHPNLDDPEEKTLIGTFDRSASRKIGTIYKHVGVWDEYNGVNITDDYYNYAQYGPIYIRPISDHFIPGSSTRDTLYSIDYWSPTDIDIHWYKNPNCVVYIGVQRYQHSYPIIATIRYDDFGTKFVDLNGREWTYKHDVVENTWCGYIETTGIAGTYVRQPILTSHNTSSAWFDSTVYGVTTRDWSANVEYEEADSKLQIYTTSTPDPILELTPKMLHDPEIPSVITNNPYVDYKLTTRANGDPVLVLLFKVLPSDTFYAYAIEIGSPAKIEYGNYCFPTMFNMDRQEYKADNLTRSRVRSYPDNYWDVYRPYYYQKGSWRNVMKVYYGAPVNTLAPYRWNNENEIIVWNGTVADYEKAGYPELTWSAKESDGIIHNYQMVKFWEEDSGDNGTFIWARTYAHVLDRTTGTRLYFYATQYHGGPYINVWQQSYP